MLGEGSALLGFHQVYRIWQ